MFGRDSHLLSFVPRDLGLWLAVDRADDFQIKAVPGLHGSLVHGEHLRREKHFQVKGSSSALAYLGRKRTDVEKRRKGFPFPSRFIIVCSVCWLSLTTFLFSLFGLRMETNWICCRTHFSLLNTTVYFSEKKELCSFFRRFVCLRLIETVCNIPFCFHRNTGSILFWIIDAVYQIVGVTIQR